MSFLFSDFSCSSPDKIKFWNDKDLTGNDFNSTTTDNKEQCMDNCLADDRCKAFSFDPQNRFPVNCWMKEAASPEKFNDFSGITTGVRCNLENAPQLTPNGKYPEKGYYYSQRH